MLFGYSYDDKFSRRHNICNHLQKRHKGYMLSLTIFCYNPIWLLNKKALSFCQRELLGSKDFPRIFSFFCVTNNFLFLVLS